MPERSFDDVERARNRAPVQSGVCGMGRPPAWTNMLLGLKRLTPTHSARLVQIGVLPWLFGSVNRWFSTVYYKHTLAGPNRAEHPCLGSNPLATSHGDDEFKVGLRTSVTADIYQSLRGRKPPALDEWTLWVSLAGWLPLGARMKRTDTVDRPIRRSCTCRCRSLGTCPSWLCGRSSS